jgi:segregation and condensation protein B
MRLTQIIEALLFASDAPLSAADLSRVDERLDEDTVEAVIQELRAEYELSERSFQIYEVGGGFQLLTRPEFVTVLERYDSVPQPSRLSAPALEVLAIIAYRQPLGRAEIEEIRGVGSSGVLRTLQERSLIEPVGRGEGLGRPLLYGTTRKFLEHFGFRSLEDLPRPDELPVILRDRPQPVSMEPLEETAPSPESAEAVTSSESGEAAPSPENVEAASSPESAEAVTSSEGGVSAPSAENADVEPPPESVEAAPSPSGDRPEADVEEAAGREASGRESEADEYSTRA